MARPIKDGIDYFPLNTELDTKFELIEAQFGLTGFAVIVKLLQKIYGGDGYYCEWTNEIALLFTHKLGFSEDRKVVSDIVNAAIKRGIFDKDMFEKYHILTSKGIQKRYFEAVNRRKCFNVKTEYLLINVAKKHDNVDNNSVNVVINPENVCNNSQRREKERREEEIRGERESTRALGEYNNVILTDPEIEKLKAECMDYLLYIDRLSSYMQSTGKKYKSHYATIKNWAIRDGKIVKENKLTEFENEAFAINDPLK